MNAFPPFGFVWVGVALALTYGPAASAQTPPPPAKRLPPEGIVIPDRDRTDLTAGAAALRAEIDSLTPALAGNTRLAALLPDVEIFHKAVDWPLRYGEFFDPKQIETARHLLKVGHERSAQLRAGSAPWIDATGLIIRGYRSKLDGSVQPYALVVPTDWKRGTGPARRLDVVLAGRNDKRTELAFIAEHERSPGEIVPPGAIVLHPYGRFCNATKFAGEVDVFEAMQATRRAYKIDANRIVVRGFSMGGASTWHLAAHFPDTWAAASPGAGFAETPVYTKALAPGKPERTWWEQKLWHWYNATDSAANLRSVPTVAYSGEIDPQKQSADLMEQAMATEGLKLERLIGPQTAHKYHPETKVALATRLDEIVAQGRPLWPSEDHLTTYTLRYPSSSRIKIMELEQPWERADVDLRFPSPERLEVKTRNVGVFNVTLQNADGLKVTIDGQDVPLGDILPYYWFVKEAGRWVFKDHTFTDARWRKQTRKMPGLSGPVDDAFMEPFIFVRPTGKPLHEALGKWADSEMAHAIKMWRDLFRGDVTVKDDTAVTEEDLASKHLILWGDPSSNAFLARILPRLPLGWDGQSLAFGGKTYDATHHAPILVFPNPLSTQQRYVALNSGIDFRDEGYGTNALQVPKLPDFAIIDLREEPGPRWPGKIVDAGFFDAAWKLPVGHGGAMASSAKPKAATMPTQVADPPPSAGSARPPGRFIKHLKYTGPTAAIVQVETNAVDGRAIYADRAYTFTDLPAELVGADWVKTADADQRHRSAELMEIAVSGGTVVTIAHDERVAVPAWMSNQFQPAAGALKINNRPMQLLQRRVDADSTLTLGANNDATPRAANMYVVLVSAAK